MVKGNWERRAELGMLRREAEKETKAKRRAGVKSGSAIAASLHARSTGSETPWSIVVYLFAEDEGLRVCSRYLRGDACDQKDFKKGARGMKKGCRLSHDTETLAGLEGTGSIEEDDEQAVVGPFELSSISTKRYAKIAFIAVDNVLVFDHRREAVWLESEFAAAKSRSGSVVDAPLASSEKEGVEETEDVVAKCPPTLEEGGTSSSAMLLLKALKKEIGYVSCFLENQETARMREVCKEVKSFIASNSTIRARLRESQSLKSRVLAKRKKDEKKKKETLENNTNLSSVVPPKPHLRK